MAGICSYCLGEGIVVTPLNNDIKEAEKNNFISSKCPVCAGTKESESEDTYIDEYYGDEDLLVDGIDDEIPEPLIEEEDENEDS